ncbi:MAG: PQQ-dependent sugar dehydrogenase, partial [Chthoniobacterales bacterium]
MSGLSAPVAVTNAGDQRLFVTEQAGRIRIVDLSTNPPTLNATAFLDIHLLVRSPANGGGGEQGFLSVAFDPNYATNGFFYVYYVNLSGNIVIASYSVSADPNIANTTGTILLTIPHPTNENHNGGQLQFGKDGFLYLGTGDGGSGNDPPNNAQTKSVLLGKILRLKVNGPAAYEIPPGNPFADDGDPNTLPEIWAYGLRNPFRFTVDRQTG